MIERSWPAFVIQIAGVLALVWIGVQLAPRREPSPVVSSESGSPSPGIEHLEQALRAHEARLAALESGAPTSTPKEASTGRQPVGEPLDVSSVASEIAKLRVELARLATRANDAAARAGSTNWAAIDTARERAAADPEGVSQEFLLMPVDDVLLRFGKPYTIQVGQDGTEYWDYRRLDVDGELRTHFQLAVRDGRVTHAGFDR